MEVREKIAERVKKSCEASAWQRALRLRETLATLGETLALMGKALALQEVARHCWETLGGLRVEGLGMGSLGVDSRLGVLGWEGGRESGKVVEGWSGEARE